MKKTTTITVICIGSFAAILALVFFPQNNAWPSLGKERGDHFSDAKYVISFSQQGRGPAGDGTISPIYEVRSDGSALRFVKNAVTAEWQENSQSIQSSMGGFTGDLASPDATKQLVIRQSWFHTPRVAVQKNGQEVNLFRGRISEILWLPDNRRIVVADGKAIWIVDTETGSLQRILSGEVAENAFMFHVADASN